MEFQEEHSLEGFPQLSGPFCLGCDFSSVAAVPVMSESTLGL